MQNHDNDPQRSNQQAAWSLARRLLLFLSPLLLIALTAEAALWTTGETWPASRVVRQQQGTVEQTIYCRDFLSQQFGVYKAASIKTRKPQILAVGSSRVMQIRDFMFAPLQESFYNAGGMTQSVTELGEFVDLLEQDELPGPSVVIIGIDPWWIKAERHRDKSWLAQPDEAFHFSAHINALRRIVRRNRFDELFTSVFNPKRSPYFGYRAIGTAAMKYGSGFRKDGSWQYSPRIMLELAENQQYIDREDPPIVQRIRSHVGDFSVPATFDREKSARLLSYLDRLGDRGIELFAVMPPYSSECLHALSSDSDFGSWWNAYSVPLVDQLRSRGIPVIPAAEPKDYGLDDRYMIDGYHAGEVFMGHIAIDVLAAAPPDSLLRQVDREALQAQIASAESPLGFEAQKREFQIALRIGEFG